VTYVLTLDQRSSRRRPDHVEALVSRLGTSGRAGLLRPFERTAGDEAQGVVATPGAVGDIVVDVLREGDWYVGLGIGPVEEPLPASTRAGRGLAFVRARQAVNRAKTAPYRTCVVGADDYRAEHVETVLWLLASVLRRRTEHGWEVADMLAAGSTRGQIAEALGISASAVSQRAQAAGVAEEQRGRSLLVRLLAEADR
jgi:hypothetical protein